MRNPHEFTKMMFLSKYGTPENQEHVKKYVDGIIDENHPDGIDSVNHSSFNLNSDQIHRLIDINEKHGNPDHWDQVALIKNHYKNFTDEHWGKIKNQHSKIVAQSLAYMPAKHLADVYRDTRHDGLIRSIAGKQWQLKTERDRTNQH